MATNARWRLDHHGVHDVEVDLGRATTVGELANALAHHLDGPARHVGELPAGQGARGIESQAETALTIESPHGVLDPRRPAQETVPSSGATIRLVAADSFEQVHGGTRGAPVTLSTEAGRRALDYGSSAITEGVQIHVANDVIVVDEGTKVIHVDGARVRGYAVLRDGSMIRCRDWAATVRIHGALRPPPAGGPIHRLPVSRGEWTDHSAEPVELPNAPERYRPPGFPWLTAMVPLLMAGGLWAVTRSLMMVGFMAFSFVYVIASGIEGRLESRKADVARVEDFREELAMADAHLESRRRAQETRDEMHHPAGSEVMEWVRPLSHRLWERSGAHPHPMSVRLGVADQVPDDPARAVVTGRPELRDELSVVLRHNDPQPRPLTVDLAETGGLAIVGDHLMTTALAGSVVAQLAMLTPPDQLSLSVPTESPGWRWTSWLPHLAPGAPKTLTVLARSNKQPPPDNEAPVLWVAPDTVGLPESIRALVRIDADGHSSLQLDNSTRQAFEMEQQSPATLENAARRIAGLEPGSATAASSLPESVSLADLGVSPAADSMARRWGESLPEELAVPLGRMAGGGVLTLDLVTDGPHALIGGTTGAGKSELLRTMLAALAGTHSPERINLLLVDYKGGAAFGPLADLPHCVGLVT
ncbi:MAG: FtsK/SpoIIIE domain-containing protein, partial [Microthrixaceae bacterium]